MIPNLGKWREAWRKNLSVYVMLGLFSAFVLMSCSAEASDQWMKENRWGKWGKDDEVGVLNEITPQTILNAVGLIKKGKIYDLETLRFKGMPVWPGHSGWDILPYGSPMGRRNMQPYGIYGPEFNWYAAGGWLDSAVNKYDVGLNSEVILGPLHVGTHIDSLAHLTQGKDDVWWNGFNAGEHWSDFGPLKADASNIPPIILRGILLDIPGYKGVAHLNPGYEITADDIKGCAKWANVEIKEGDAVLIRTGMTWPAMNEAPGSGPGLEAVKYLIGEKNVFLIGNDQAAFEAFPEGKLSTFPNHVHPVHDYMLIRKGVHIIEMVMTNELAKDKVYEFCFITLPAKVKGATGMMIRPIAII